MENNYVRGERKWGEERKREEMREREKEREERERTYQLSGLNQEEGKKGTINSPTPGTE
jgi:hypothetical protein